MKRIALIGSLALVLAFSVFGIATATAGRGGQGGGKGGGGGGHIDPVFAIASQSPGSVTFSVMIDSGSQPSLVVSNNCYDGMSQLNYSASLPVAWQTSTIGYAGPFSPPSGEKCYAWVHTSSSDSALPGGTFSYVAP